MPSIYEVLYDYACRRTELVRWLCNPSKCRTTTTVRKMLDEFEQQLREVIRIKMAQDCLLGLLSTAQISNGSLNVKCSSARAFPWAWSWAVGLSSDLRALPARRSPVAAPHDRASAVARQRKAALRASSHARRSIEGCTKGPESAFLWISKTVSFGTDKRNGFWRIRLKGASLWSSDPFCAHKKETRRQAKPGPALAVFYFRFAARRLSSSS